MRWPPRLRFAAGRRRDIAGMRHRPTHAYFEVDQDILWNTIPEDVPRLLRQIRTLLDKPEL